MAFQSILYEHGPASAGSEPRQPPEYFRDWNLDRVVNAIAAGREEYDLAPFFYAPLKTIEAIQYRVEIMRDLENDRVFECLGRFAGAMRLMREQLEDSRKFQHKYQKERWF